MPRVVAGLLCALGVAVALSALVNAEGGPPYRRTTPRGSFGIDGPELVVGVPGGRAWGIESALIPVPDQSTGFRATVEVSDPQIREAFIRIAWYDRSTGRPRQFALTDARFVRAGETATLEVTLDPPAGAVAYRVRVLARLRSPDALSAADAIRVNVSAPYRIADEIPATRLLP
ncbi:MAG: hypothetical protein M3O99_06965 [Chloroflexota bacterium]|nr:hypothetical protein [Chloroflexota bacterium]